MEGDGRGGDDVGCGECFYHGIIAAIYLSESLLVIYQKYLGES